MVLAALLGMLGGGDALGQSEPIPGYFELQVAYCAGMYIAMIPENKALADEVCSFKTTTTEDCESTIKGDAVWQDQANALRDYLLTGTVDGGANTGVALALARGKQFATDLSDGSPELTSQEIKDRTEECINVVKSLPY